MLLPDGKYTGEVIDVAFFENSKGNLTAKIRVHVEGHDINYMSYVENDGRVLNAKEIDRLAACFPTWDRTLDGLERMEGVRNVVVQCVIKNEEKNGKTYSNLKWINPIRPGADFRDGTMTLAEIRAKRNPQPVTPPPAPNNDKDDLPF